MPTAGETDQLTRLFPVPVTVAENIRDWPPASDTAAGDTEIPMTGGNSEIVAEADLVGSAALVAVRVTVCAAVIVAGAV